MVTDSNYKDGEATGITFVVLAFTLALSIACNILMLDKIGAMRNAQPSPAVADTQRVIIFDTSFVSLPVPRDSVVLCYKVVTLPAVRDTILMVPDGAKWVDSALVEVPIEQKVYGDSTYKAYVSGFDVSLDSIFVYRTAEVQTIKSREKGKRWSLGLTAGYGASKDGLTPFVGIGLTYTLFDF